MVINTDETEDYFMDQIVKKDLGQAFIYDRTALIVRSSHQILFFKLQWDKNLEKKRWKTYHKLDIMGLCVYQKGSDNMQIANEDKIYFYRLDYETHMPILENVINNFMNCSLLLFSNDTTSITFKINCEGFQV